MTKRGRRDTLSFFAFTGIAILGYVLFYLYPIGRTIFLSFTDLKITSLQSSWVGLGNYSQAIQNDDILHLALANTVKYAVVVGVGKMAIALGAALLLNRRVRGIGFFRAVFFLPFVIPAFAVAYIFRFFFHPANGLVNGMLGQLGIQGPGWYADSDTALQTLMLASLWSFGIPMLTFLAALQNVPTELYEVAELDGASAWMKFRTVTLPAISKMVLFNAVLISIDTLKSFDLAFLFGRGNGYPANSTLLYSVYLFNQAFTSPYRLGYASAVAIVFALILLALTAMNFVVSRLYVKDDD